MQTVLEMPDGKTMVILIAEELELLNRAPEIHKTIESVQSALEGVQEDLEIVPNLTALMAFLDKYVTPPKKKAKIVRAWPKKKARAPVKKRSPKKTVVKPKKKPAKKKMKKTTPKAAAKPAGGGFTPPKTDLSKPKRSMIAQLHHEASKNDALITAEHAVTLLKRAGVTTDRQHASVLLGAANARAYFERVETGKYKAKTRSQMLREANERLTKQNDKPL